MAQRFMTGNRVIIMLDGKRVGVAIQSFSPSDDYGQQPVHQLGDAKAIEYVDGAHRYSITVTAVFIEDDSLANAIFAADSEDPPEVDFLCIDKRTGKATQQYIRCTRASKSRSYTANQLATENIAFNACDRRSEASIIAGA